MSRCRATRARFAEQIGDLEGFLARTGAPGISPTTGNPVYTRPIILTIRREDHSFLLDPIMPRPGRVMADYISSSPRSPTGAGRASGVQASRW